MHEEILKIPKDRIAILIGREGETKKNLEMETGARINVDSGNGEIEIISKEKDAYKFLKIIRVVKAIGRGFNPEKAKLLLKDDYSLDIVDVGEITGKSSKTSSAKKGRVIGREGTTREKIERETDTYLSVQGKTIAIIGKIEALPRARKAVEMLLEGAMHKTAYTYLENTEKEFEL